MVKTSERGFLFKFKFSNSVAFELEFGNNYVRFYAKHGQVLNGSVPLEVATPYSSADLWNSEIECCNLQITQVADVLYLFHPKHPTRTLTRYANNDWRLAIWEIRNGPWGSVNTNDDLRMTPSGTTGSITITAGGNVFTAGDVGRLIRLTLINDDTKPWVNGENTAIGNIRTSDGHYYKALSAGTTGNTKPVHTEGTKSDGAIVWEYLHSGYGTAKITKYTSATQVTATVIDTLPSNLATTYWEMGMIYPGAPYPLCGSFFKNRFFLLIDTPEGLKCCASCAGDYDNFSDKEHGEVLTESAFTVPIDSNEKNEGRWLSSGDVLFVGTSSGEFYIDAMAQNEAIGPGNAAPKQISKVGSKPIPPIVINGHTLFIDRFGTSIRDLTYSLERDGYDPYDLSIFGRHLLKSGVIDWDYQDLPDKLIWCAMGDGRLISFTFNSEQQVFAPAQHYLSGSVEAVAVIPSPNERRDDAWFIVRRTVGNVTKRYVEWLDEGTVSDYTSEIESIADVEDREYAESEYTKQNAYYVDSGLVWNRAIGDTSTEITGFEHLEGFTVAIMADGAERPRQKVVNGTIKIKETDAKVTAGLPVGSTLQPQKIYIPSESSAGLGARQRIDHLILMLYRSGGGKMGDTYKDMAEILYRKTDEEMGKSVDLFSGNIITPWPGGTSQIKDKGANIIIFNDSVFPMHILSISPSLTSA